MQLLKINRKFFEVLNDEDNKKILRIYGYENRETFLEDLIKKLNDQYNFLSITGYEFFPQEEDRLYFMYNGYISGDLNGFKEVVISFTNIWAQSRNTWFNQQVVPMITSKLEINKEFLIDDKIKKICLLTTHKSNIMSKDKNIAAIESTFQMTTRFANNIGFEFVEIFPMKNLSLDTRYNSVEEIIEHTNYLQNKSSGNSQFKQLRKENGIFVASFEEVPQGQEQKFFALKILAAAHLLKGRNIDINKAVAQTTDRTVRVLDEYIKYLQSIDTSKYSILNVAQEDFDTNTPESAEFDDIGFKLGEDLKGVPEYKLPVRTTYSSKGRKIFKTQKKYKTVSIANHKYMCGCDDDKHLYFRSNLTKENFVEGHHMIPMENQHQYWSEYQTNLDCTENITPLCPHCHSKIHYAVPAERNEILSSIYNKYKENLKKIDPELTLEKFASFYNVYIY